MLETERPAKHHRLCGSDYVVADVTTELKLEIKTMLETERSAKRHRVCDSESIAHITKISPLHGQGEYGNILVSRKRGLKLITDCCYFPKENGLSPQGEDSHFICEEEQVFGVADGVGGWARKGIDAGEYARELMFNCAMVVRDGRFKGGSINPLTVLKEAYSNTIALGSSTACIVALTDDNCLHFANVGDSRFIVIRGDSIVYKSQPQQRRFNCPFQLGNHLKSDTPSSAYEFKVEVEDGDVIVAGTDGLFDNLFEENIVRDVNEMTGWIGKCPYYVAGMIAEAAKIISKSDHLPTPFSLDAEIADKIHSGGKIDDITVLVAYVVSSSSA